MANTILPMRPYSSGINRGTAPGGGLGAGATTQQREAQRLERERNERAERERVERAGQTQLGDLSEEQREEINEAVCLTRETGLVASD
jgi:centrin-3